LEKAQAVARQTEYEKKMEEEIRKDAEESKKRAEAAAAARRKAQIVKEQIAKVGCD
jgi:hypothetical protein